MPALFFHIAMTMRLKVPHSARYAGIFLGLFTLLQLSAAAQESRYFPDRGAAAVHQRALDLQGGAVVLSLALQPGYEDLPLLSLLRTSLGARVVTVYVTNGDATPSDASGDAPQFVAAQRKEEAYQACRVIGGQSHFLNIPDPGIVESRGALEAAWNPDTLVFRLAGAIRSYRPDLLLLHRDFRGGDGATVRLDLLGDCLRRAIVVAEHPTELEQTHGILPWTVQRIYVETMSGGRETVALPKDVIHPVWKKPYRSIGNEALAEYHTLRLQLPRWLSPGVRTYKRSVPKNAPVGLSFLSGLPVVTPKLTRIASVVRHTALKGEGGRMTASLAAVSAAIDSVERFLRRNAPSMDNAESRLLSEWKNRLEDLRCSVLGVGITVVPSESLITGNQLFFLRFTGFESATSKTYTKILFPMAMDHTWGINQSVNYQFDFTAPSEFNVLSPQSLEYNTPGSLYGLSRPLVRTRFSFIIYHGDSIRSQNFVYRGEVQLRTGPRRSFELLTPAIRALAGEPVGYGLLNFSRDPFEGEVFIRDSLVGNASKHVFLARKDQLIRDTLALALPKPLPPGDYPARLELSGRGGYRTFFARSFEASIDSGRRVALITGISGSPAGDALRRLRMPFVTLDSAKVEQTDFGMFNVMIIDRDATVAMPGFVPRKPAVLDWVRKGGHLIILPPLSGNGNDLPLPAGTGFLPFHALSPGSAVVTDSTQSVLRTPNKIQSGDWSDWIVARSWGAIQTSGWGEVPVRSGADNAPLLVTGPEGKGRITMVGLDLPSQMINVHPGVHRLFANILSLLP